MKASMIVFLVLAAIPCHALTILGVEQYSDTIGRNLPTLEPGYFYASTSWMNDFSPTVWMSDKRDEKRLGSFVIEWTNPLDKTDIKFGDNVTALVSETWKKELADKRTIFIVPRYAIIGKSKPTDRVIRNRFKIID